MNASVIVRTSGGLRQHYLTVNGAYARMRLDAEELGCESTPFDSFCAVIEEGRELRLVSELGVVSYRAEPLLD